MRQRLQVVKVDAPPSGVGPSLLLVRDQAQGFCTGENHHTDGVVRRTMEFRRDLTEKVLSYAVERARLQCPGQGAARVLMAYKFHLLDGALDTWVTDIAARYDVPLELDQPDTVDRNLITHGFPDRTVVVAGVD
ncbi:hypothetical protein [Streptomyces sp. DvalAA-19]|uniref:hypothetical protein n=1 Tax=Streptomyces sp. DvalAA-19 TaxID=1839761 RepID=UPI00081B450C|nr:hypothetical protein [Streptomyces sp. DvalAA-19]SCD59756.1 hypothetical protein GA0115244_106837 [Streptomyces sp. DvalAA-19]